MENKGIEVYPEVISDEIVNIEVRKLLDGVDLEKTKRDMRTTEPLGRAIRLFYSYSHKDESIRDELETHLKIMQRQGLIESWHDRKITPGDNWKNQIDENLERADIILLLVSQYSMASDYCQDVEMKRVLERHKAGEAVAIPIILRDVDWQKTCLGELQALPKNGKPVTKWNPKDTAWRNVSEGIEKVIEQLTKRP
jgi:internalin A